MNLSEPDGHFRDRRRRFAPNAIYGKLPTLKAIDHRPDLASLFREHADALGRFFSRRHADAALADDLVQETFLRYAKGLEKGALPEQARAYLFGVARRVSLEAWRAGGRERRLRDGLEQRQAQAEAERAAVDLAARIGGSDEALRVHEALRELSPEHREVLDLRFSQNLRYAEIAEALDLPLGTVRSRLHHAIAAVRRALPAKAAAPQTDAATSLQTP